MSILKTFFLDIKQKITAEVPAIKTIRLFNSQPENESRENSFAYPAAFIEFRSLEWGTLLNKYQQGRVTLSIHICMPSLKTEDEQIFDLQHSIYDVLQGFQGSYFTSLMRVRDIQDVNHDGLIVWRTDFEFQINDQSLRTKHSKPVSATLEINKDLDIDNVTIRTGDGQ